MKKDAYVYNTRIYNNSNLIAKWSDLIGRATFLSSGQLVVHNVTRPLFRVRLRGLGHETRARVWTSLSSEIIPSEARFYSGSAEIVWLQSIFIAWF